MRLGKIKQKAIVVDIDGTIALKGDRSPYDWDSVDKDTINKTIVDLVNLLGSHYIVILVSGRDASCKEKTIDWLEKNDIDYDLLFMREEGNNEKDVLIKQRIYNKLIKDNYKVQFVLDDRNQTVAGWREIGLTCLQVAEGDF